MNLEKFFTSGSRQVYWQCIGLQRQNWRSLSQLIDFDLLGVLGADDLVSRFVTKKRAIRLELRVIKHSGDITCWGIPNGDIVMYDTFQTIDWAGVMSGKASTPLRTSIVTNQSIAGCSHGTLFVLGGQRVQTQTM